MRTENEKLPDEKFSNEKLSNERLSKGRLSNERYWGKKTSDGKPSYEDMLDLPHHVSAKHPRMPLADRAAQFSPFAALTGYEEAVRETARLTDERIDLDESEKAVIDPRLQIVQEHIGEHPKVSMVCFAADEKKSGGAYIEVSGAVKKLDLYGRKVVMEDGREIAVEDIVELRL